MTAANVVSRTRVVAAGVVAGVVALGVGELAASARSTWQSPVVGVAEAIIERVPRSVKDFAIGQFGRNDKLALVTGILAVSVIFAALLGLLARNRFSWAAAGFGLFALVGVWGSQQAYTSSSSSAIPSLVAGAAGVGTLWLLAGPRDSSQPDAESTSRRMFLVTAAGMAAVAALAAAGGRALRSRFSAASSRAAVTLPGPTARRAAAPAGVSLDVEGVSSFFTPNEDFYRIDTAVQVPQIRAEDWSLRIHGMVERELLFTYDDLLRRDLTEADITLTCVSNTVGGGLLGTARWLGVPLMELIGEAGVMSGADQLVGRSVDGWTSGFPLEILGDGRTALLAIGMNGEPLPLEHGFPARVIVSGIYGYVSSTKWVTELEVTRFDDFDAYWVKRGWDERAPIKTESRIDTPRTLAKLSPGTVNIGGVAWAQTIGISRVEVAIDDDEFSAAVLAEQLSVDTWRLWSMAWDAAPGRHRLTVRATDADGVVQTDSRAEPFPNGASGWMSIFVDVLDA